MMTLDGHYIFGTPGPRKVIGIDENGYLGWASIVAQRDMAGIDVFIRLKFDHDTADEHDPPFTETS